LDSDDEKNRPIASRYQIKGFPTLKIFRYGVVSEDYDGGRTADAIVTNLKKQNLPAVSPLTDSATALEFSTSDKVVAIGFFDNKDSAEQKIFHIAANDLRKKISFGEVVGNHEIATSFGLTETPAVIVFKTFDGGNKILTKDDFSTLGNTILAHSVPLIDEIGPENFQYYAESGLPLAYLFVKPEEKDQYVSLVQTIAESSKGKVNWVWIDWNKFARHAEKVGLSGKVVPAVAIDAQGKHFVFDETATINTEAVNQWVKSFLDGALNPTIRSEEIPQSNDEPVKIVVAKTFDQIVMDPTKDVFVEFYAPWCGHCKQLAPTFDELAKRFSPYSTVVVAKMDATANDVDPKYNVRGFPTLKFFRATDKVPLDYEGDRSLNNLVSFIEDHASLVLEAVVGKDEL